MLYCRKTGKKLSKGDKVKTHAGEEMVLQSWLVKRNRIYLRAKGETIDGEYFPSVIDAEFRAK